MEKLHSNLSICATLYKQKILEWIHDFIENSKVGDTKRINFVVKVENIKFMRH